MFDKKQFSAHLIKDLQAFETLLNEDRFEKGIQRIGAEQEFCLIDYHLRPKMVAMPLLELLDDPHFTTELAQFNMEANLDPLVFKDNCFSQFENDLIQILTKANKKAHELGAKIILTGILPTIRTADIQMQHMTPVERYKALNDAILAARDSDFTFNINGVDELITSHDNVLFESCNTSFQVHYQLEAEQAVSLFNWAHAISGPVLAATTNSPVFMGKRLWCETRIALFHQSTDTRQASNPLREERPRVSFGTHWETQTPLQIYQDAASHYKILLPFRIEEDALEVLKAGGIPKLKALSLLNGTIYRWNRMCYGVTNGLPHLRIENRYLPAGPTVIDEVANAAFWTGLMNGMPDNYRNIPDKMEFDQAKSNFRNAAKVGLQCQFKWFGNKLIPAQELILKELLPIAKEGLKKAKIKASDRSKYLDIIEERVSNNRTGCQWIVNSYNKLKKGRNADQALVALTEGIYKRQKSGAPVHRWSELDPSEGGGWRNKYQRVEQVMTKDLITAHEDDLLDLARNIMIWSNIHHIPVEGKQGELVGLITSDQLLRLAGTQSEAQFKEHLVGDIMHRNLNTIDPQSTTIEAYQLMKNKEIGCLPVVEKNKLVGIITIHDFVKLMAFFLDEME
jgi:CBS domain-containing protein